MELTSQIFKPYRKIGSYCIDRGFCVETIGSKNYITTSIGNSFLTLESKNLRLIAASEHFPGKIRSLASTENEKLICACENKIFICFRGESTCPPINFDSIINEIFTIGEILLIRCENGDFISYDIKEKKQIFCVNFKGACAIKTWCHPPTYINKIVIGLSNGVLEIWDLLRCKSIKTLKSYENLSIIKESPALDIIAVCASDYFYLHDIKDDVILFSFKSSLNSISSISFQKNQFSFSNNSIDSYDIQNNTYVNNQNLVAISGEKGPIIILDLSVKKLISTIDFHSGIIVGSEFLSTGELVTASADNRINIYVLDANLQPRLLKFRSGISDRISKLRFVRNGGLSLLAAYGSSLRFLNPNRDEQSVEFARTKKIKEWKQKTMKMVNLGEIIDFDADAAKEYFWENIVTCHDKTKWAHAWRLDNKAMGKKKLKLEILKNQSPTCVCILACCNSCVLGYNFGALEIFNLQSGRHCGSFIDTDFLSGRIIGVAGDGRNIHVASIDNDYLRIWFYSSKNLKSRLKLDFIPNRIDINRENSLVAISGFGYVIIVDIITSTITRNFKTDYPIFTDICISTDGRWLISANTRESSENFLEGKFHKISIWDLPSSKLIDYIETEKAVSSLTLSYNKSLLAIAFESEYSITLLVNYLMFSDEIIQPVNSRANNNSKEKLDFAHNHLECIENLATLSLLPESKWKYLDKIDLIMERSKPTENDIIVSEAPFFIPTVPGLKTVFDIEDPKPKKKRGKKQPPCVLLSKDVQNYKPENKDDILDKLMKYSPAELDVQISLMIESDEDLKKFLDILIDLLTTYQCLDFVQGIISLLLNIHSERLMDPSFNEYLKKILEFTQQKWDCLKKSCDQSLSVLGFIRSNVTNF